MISHRGTVLTRALGYTEGRTGGGGAGDAVLFSSLHKIHDRRVHVLVHVSSKNTALKRGLLGSRVGVNMYLFILSLCCSCRIQLVMTSSSQTPMYRCQRTPRNSKIDSVVSVGIDTLVSRAISICEFRLASVYWGPAR